MIAISRRYFFVRVKEVYYSDVADFEIPDADIAVFVQCRVAANEAEEFYTSHIDLNKPEDELFRQIGENVRYEIRRAENKDACGFVMEEDPDMAEIEHFCNFYDTFARTKGLPHGRPIKRNMLSRLHAFSGAGALTISMARNLAYPEICYHVYLRGQSRARLLYSASLFRGQSNAFRNLVGRANRHLHWTDIKHFRNEGLSIYDFGGLALDDTNEETSNIDAFKRSFGGTDVTEYTFTRPLTTKGRLALRAKRCMQGHWM